VDNNIKDPCNCGNCGCLEQVASATGIVRLAKEEMSASPDMKTILNPADISSKSVFDAYKAGDELAAKIGRLVASHASAQTQNNVFASKLIHGREFSRPQRGLCTGPQEREGSAHL
jgi:predicted NBD/HSP70 family sugar kinase